MPLLFPPSYYCVSVSLSCLLLLTFSWSHSFLFICDIPVDGGCCIRPTGLLQSPASLFFSGDGKQWNDCRLPPTVIPTLKCFFGISASPLRTTVYTLLIGEHRYDGIFSEHIWKVASSMIVLFAQITKFLVNVQGDLYHTTKGWMIKSKSVKSVKLHKHWTLIIYIYIYTHKHICIYLFISYYVFIYLFIIS